jgi:hypothetical protein
MTPPPQRSSSPVTHTSHGPLPKLRLRQSPRGRATLRERTAVAHALAHIAARKGDTARYVGVRKNLCDLRRAAAIQNLEAVHRFALAA